MTDKVIKKYGEDAYKKWGAKGGKAKVRKGIAVYLEKMTPEERRLFYANRNAKRWGNAKDKTR